jgi:hypothetical protein
MAKHRDLGVAFDVSNELIRASRDDKVDILVQFEEFWNDISGC